MRSSELALAVGVAAAGAAWYIWKRLRSKGDITGRTSKVAVILGGQWGDEGKGKLVDILAQDVDVCARFNGGANAGHTLVVEGHKYAFHLLPCGMINRSAKNVIGNGVVVHIPTLLTELDNLKEFDPDALKRLFISDRAQVLLDTHRAIDGLLEQEKSGSATGALGAAIREKVRRMEATSHPRPQSSLGGRRHDQAWHWALLRVQDQSQRSALRRSPRREFPS